MQIIEKFKRINVFYNNLWLLRKETYMYPPSKRSLAEFPMVRAILKGCEIQTVFTENLLTSLLMYMYIVE